MRFVKRGNRKAFTLLEVILAITILSTMALITAQALTRALKARAKIQAEVDDVSALRDSLRMIRTDLNMAFHYRDVEKELQDLAAKPVSPTGIVPGQPPTAPQGPQRQTKRYDPVTNFIGDESSMNFVTLNSGRMSSAIVQADFVEVGYALKDCTNLSTNLSSKCLYRRIQNVLDEDVKTGGNEIVMLENVSEFKLRYIADTKQDWAKSWDSSPSAYDVNTRGRFPEAVEVSLSIEREFDGKPRTYSMQLVVPIHFPNNPSSKSGGLSNGAAAPGQQQQGGGQIDQ